MDNKKFVEIEGKYKAILRSLPVLEGINEDMYVYLFMATKEFFNLEPGIVIPEFISFLEPIGEPEIVDEVTLRLTTIEGKTLDIKAALPPQGEVDGVKWHGIPDLKKLLMKKE